MGDNLKKQNIQETDIAIVGISCRFPGAKNIEDFWNNLINKKESISFFEDKDIESGFYDITNNPNFVKAGAVLDNVKTFDAEFFGFSEKEAKILDPQHRKFLECSWEALEDGGYNPEIFDGSIGVFAGSGTNTYLLNYVHPNIGYHKNRTFLESMNDIQILLANDRDYLATRVAYKLNLKGPAINTQTACSSSLVSIHLACQSLINGECDMALAGTANILCPQKTGYLYQEDMIFSPDGHCRPFDAKAKGLVFGSGVGVILLKKMSDAIRDNDSIYAVIKGTAINNDGSDKVAYSAPSVNGQSSVIAEAIAVANLNPEDITFIEGHGTATQLGDLIEVSALKKVFQTEKKNYCALGSVKSNIGHLGWASGMAGILKTILAIKNKKIPPTINFENQNQKINLDSSPFFINKKTINWESDNIRYAGVSAFGFGGTNSHIVLSEFKESSDKESVKRFHLLTLSAKNKCTLKIIVDKYLHYINNNLNLSLSDICYTSNIGRKHLEERVAFVVSSIEELKIELKKIIKLNSFEKYFNLRYQKEGVSSCKEENNLQVLRDNYEKCKEIDFDFIYKNEKRRRLHLPTYPFQQKEYWVDIHSKSDLYQENFKKINNFSNNFYELHYKEKPQYANVSNFFSNTKQLKKEIQKQIKEIAIQSGIKNYDRNFNLLENISLQMIINAFYELGFEFNLSTFTIDEFIKKFKIDPHFKKLVNRLFEILKEEGIVYKEKDKCKIIKKPDINIDFMAGNFLAEFELLQCCGSKLSEVLRGKADPLDLLFLNGDIYLVKDFYTKNPTLKAMNSIIAASVTYLQSNLPRQAGLRILEIGSGTGSTTSSVLEKILNNVKYEFTDISNRFISEAKNNLSNHSFISYSQLNIEKNLDSQGFGSQKYDIILATNVLHATSNLTKTIKNVKKLLASKGILILLEGTAPVRWVDITFGLTDGWWHFSDYDLRPDYPLINSQKWKKFLLNNDFDNVDFITSSEVGRSVNTDGGMPQSVIFAQKNKIINKFISEKIVLFIDKSGVGRKLAKKISKIGHKYIMVNHGSYYKKNSDNEFTVNYSRLEDFNLLFNTIKQPINKIVYLWSLDDVQKTNFFTKDIENQYLQDCGGLLNVIKSLVNNVFTNVDVFVVTKGVQMMNNNINLNELLHSTIWGMSRVITLEHPEFNCKTIDIESEGDIDSLARELFNNNQDNQVIFNKNKRYSLELTKKSVDSLTGSIKLNFDRNAIYLIAGGLGGIGLKIAEWFIDLGCRHVALVGRSKPTDEVLGKINNLNDKEAKVHIVQCDISDYKDLKKAYSKLELVAPIKGIFQVAGVVNDHILLKQNFESLLTPVDAKIKGSWNLHVISSEKEVNLDFFVMFSSVVSLIGNIGQANHAAANNFINNLASYRKSCGLSATAIQWGAWSGIGTLNKYPEVVEKLKAIGINLIHPDEGIKVLKFVLENNLHNIAYSPIDWELFLKTNKLEKYNFFSDFLSSNQKNSDKNFSEEDIVYKISSLSESDLFAVIKEKVSSCVFSILGLKDINNSLENDFFDLGMDSLSSIQLRNNLQSDFKCRLHPTVAYKYSNILDLSSHLLNIVKKNDYSIIENTNNRKKSSTNLTNKRELSMQQKRWLRLSEKEYGRLLIPILFHTSLDKEVFRDALLQVVNRHEILKYKYINNLAIVVEINDFFPNNEELFVDVDNKEDQVRIIEAEVNKIRSYPPNPKDNPTWTIKCIKLSDKDFLVLLNIQHLEFDGTSISIFVDDLRYSYSNSVAGLEIFYSLSTQYSDYVQLQKQYITNNISQDRKFFKKMFKDVDRTTYLPNHSFSKNTESYSSSCYTPNQIDGIWKKLQLIGKKIKVSPFAVLCAAYGLLIKEIVKNDKVIIGTIVSSRPSPEFDKTIGPFVQPFPIRLPLIGSLEKIVKSINDLVMDINDRSMYPVSDMIDNVSIFNGMDIDTYFTDAFIMLNNYPNEANTLPKVEVLESLGPITIPDLPNFTPKKLNEIAGLFLIIDYYQGEMRFNFWYHIHRFNKEQVKKWSHKYLNILEKIIKKLDD